MAVTDCRVCATPLPADARFCMACGVDVTDPGATVQTERRDPTAELQERLARTVAGRYTVRGLLGAGGMASVFLADEIGLDRPVAIKVLPPELARDEGLVARFQREARTAARLDHPNIIPIHRVESEAGLHYFVMKYVQGRSLESVLEGPEPMPLEVALRVLREAAAALGHAHARGTVHRDVKPANIMLDQDDRVVLTDFGIARAGESTQLTQTGMIIGTPHYMAPEQALGTQMDGRADQYSLGVVAYEMIARQCPFTGDSAHTIIYKHVHEPPEPVSSHRPDLPAHLAAAISTALAKDPNERFDTMEEFGLALGGNAGVFARPSVHAGSTATAGGGQPTPSRIATVQMNAASVRTPVPTRRRRLWVGLAAGGILSVGAAAWLGSGLDLTAVAGSGMPADAATQDPPAAGDAMLGGAGGDADAGSGGQPVPVPPSYSDTTGARQSGESSSGTAGTSDGRPTSPDRQTGSDRAGPAGPPSPSPARRDEPRQEQRPPRTAPLTVGAEPWGTLFIDDVMIGDTPVVNHQLEVGRTYRIRVEREGYKPKTETITVRDPNPIRRQFTLDPGAGP